MSHLNFYYNQFSANKENTFLQVQESDLKWAQELVEKKEAMKSELEKKEEEKRLDILNKRGELPQSKSDDNSTQRQHQALMYVFSSIMQLAFLKQ